MAERMRAQGVESLWLDATGLAVLRRPVPDHRRLARGPSGSTPSRDWLPIAPAAHYLSGGVLTDLSGATALPGLWAAGEVACTGVHGANRLASNSLLEGMVFGARLAEAILAGADGPDADRGDGARSSTASASRRGAGRSRHRGPTGVDGSRPGGGRPWPDVVKTRDRLQRAMIEGAGVVRSADVARRRPGGDRGHGRRDGSAHARSTGPTASWPTWSPRPRACCARPRCAARPGAPTPAATIPETSDRWRRRIVHAADGIAVAAPRSRRAPVRPAVRS